MAGKDFLRETVEAPESPIDVSLRPPHFAEFAGQDRVVERLQLMVDAARQRSDVLQHVLLSGP
ncbi:MAG: Holliday junction branch migration DNA helicase RuvB, partial [Chthoniobacterales bacterium]